MPASDIVCNLNGVDFTWEGRRWHTCMLGPHQVQNACLALQTVKAVKARGWRLSDESVERGLSHAKMPGRMEILRENPRIIVDGGHNEDGVKAIASTIRALRFDRKLHLVIGMVADKNVKACAFTLGNLSDSVYVTQPDNERALAAEELAQVLNQPEAVRGIYPHAADAFSAALAGAAPEDTILICGSLYLVGEAEKFFSV
ncbi:MAG: glutamate ligase domain-containing protein, partial [Butyricicoccus sp.]